MLKSDIVLKKYGKSWWNEAINMYIYEENRHTMFIKTL